MNRNNKNNNTPPPPEYCVKNTGLAVNLLKSFVIGSCALIFIPFYIAVKSIPNNSINLETYPLETAVYFGIMNMLATFLRYIFPSLTLFKSLLIVDILSILIVSTVITITRPYHFTTEARWVFQYILIAIGHSLTYLVVIYILESFFTICKEV